MSVSSASSSLSHDSFDPILPRHAETSSLSEASDVDQSNHQRRFSQRQSGTFLFVPNSDANKRSSASSGLTIRQYRPEAPTQYRSDDSQASKRSSINMAPIPAPLPKPASLRSPPATQQGPDTTPLPLRERSATLANLSNPKAATPGPPTTGPMAANPKRRSLTMFTGGKKEKQSPAASPPPTPPHHSPSFPLRPTAPSSSVPALPPRRPTAQRDPSIASSSDSSRSSVVRAKLQSRFMGWGSSSSSAPAAAMSPTSQVAARAPEPPNAFKRAPPPRRIPASTPPSASMMPMSAPAQSSFQNAAKAGAKAGWNRVERFWGHGRTADSISSTGTVSTSSAMSHMDNSPIMPRPLRQPIGRGGLVFGVKLDVAVRKTRAVVGMNKEIGPDDRVRWLPALVLRCIEHLERWGVEEEGIFRISGMPSHVTRLREDFDRGADYDLKNIPPSDLDPHAVASVFKAYFRELPEPLLTHYLAKKFDDVLLPYIGDSVGSPEGLSAFGHASSTPLVPTPKLLVDLSYHIRQLPPENRILLRELTRLLKFMASRRETTRMGLTNLLLVICPSVGIASSLVKLFVEEQESLFADSGLPGDDSPDDMKGSIGRARGRENDFVRPPSNSFDPVRAVGPPTTTAAPQSRRNSVHPMLSNVPQAIPTPRRRATSVMIHTSPAAASSSSTLNRPVPTPRPPRTPSPPPRIALNIPSSPIHLPLGQPERVTSPTTPSRPVRFLTDLFGGSSNVSSAPPPRPSAPPRVSIVGKLRQPEDWSRGVFKEAGMPPEGGEQRERGAVRAAVRDFEAQDTSSDREGGKKLVRARGRERPSDGKRGTFFPFN